VEIGLIRRAHQSRVVFGLCAGLFLGEPASVAQVRIGIALTDRIPVSAAGIAQRLLMCLCGGNQALGIGTAVVDIGPCRGAWSADSR